MNRCGTGTSCSTPVRLEISRKVPVSVAMLARPPVAVTTRSEAKPSLVRAKTPVASMSKVRSARGPISRSPWANTVTRSALVSSENTPLIRPSSVVVCGTRMARMPSALMSLMPGAMVIGVSSRRSVSGVMVTGASVVLICSSAFTSISMPMVRRVSASRSTVSAATSPAEVMRK